MSESLWAASAEDLLRATASSAPTPGGGSIAAISGALGTALVQMAVAVTDDAALEPYAARLASLQETIAPAADGDVHDFTALMSAYRLPRGDDAEREARAREIARAGTAAAERPLSLVEAFVEVLATAHEVAPLVKPGIVSDVLAGRDVVSGAARAALRTADINIAQLERLEAPSAAPLRARSEALAARVGAGS